MDGSAVCVYMEGSRPILCELQSLVTYSRLPSPRRTSGNPAFKYFFFFLASFYAMHVSPLLCSLVRDLCVFVFVLDGLPQLVLHGRLGVP